MEYVLSCLSYYNLEDAFLDVLNIYYITSSLNSMYSYGVSVYLIFSMILFKISYFF